MKSLIYQEEAYNSPKYIDPNVSEGTMLIVLPTIITHNPTYYLVKDDGLVPYDVLCWTYDFKKYHGNTDYKYELNKMVCSWFAAQNKCRDKITELLFYPCEMDLHTKLKTVYRQVDNNAWTVYYIPQIYQKFMEHIKGVGLIKYTVMSSTKLKYDYMSDKKIQTTVLGDHLLTVTYKKHLITDKKDYQFTAEYFGSLYNFYDMCKEKFFDNKRPRLDFDGYNHVTMRHHDNDKIVIDLDMSIWADMNPYDGSLPKGMRTVWV